jgi:hypothetical protein
MNLVPPGERGGTYARLSKLDVRKRILSFVQQQKNRAIAE